MNSPCLSAAGVRFLAVLCPLWDWPVLAIGLLETSRPQRGCHVPHRQETLGELASLRREPDTLSREPLISPDPHSKKDSHCHTRPLMHNDASTKASQMFNSTPTFPRRDFGLDHGVGHFRPLSITRHRHLLTYHGTAMSQEGLCQV